MKQLGAAAMMWVALGAACASAPKPMPPPAAPEGGAAARDDRGLETAFDIEVPAAESLATDEPAQQDAPAQVALHSGEAAMAAQADFEEALAQRDGKAARRAADAWLLSCGPDRVDVCRGRALGALASLVRAKLPEAKAAAERLASIREADQCVRRAEAAARAGAPPTCLEAAAGTYRRLGDRLMVARCRLAKALAMSSEGGRGPEQAAQLARVDRECSEPRCASVRRRALKHLGFAQLRLDNAEAAATALLREMKLASVSLADSEKAYCRTAEVERACGALDAREGPGSCRKLERTLFGSYSFHDFSKQTASEGLTPETIKRVNAHYAVALEQCVATEAGRMSSPASVTYELSWIVTNHGRVAQAQLGQRQLDDAPLGQCLREQFTLWRYPRYEGELQHVSQAFTVHARDPRQFSGLLP